MCLDDCGDFGICVVEFVECVDECVFVEVVGVELVFEVFVYCEELCVWVVVGICYCVGEFGFLLGVFVSEDGCDDVGFCREE